MSYPAGSVIHRPLQTACFALSPIGIIDAAPVEVGEEGHRFTEIPRVVQRREESTRPTGC